MVFSVKFSTFVHKNHISVHTVGKLYENCVQQRIETIEEISEYSIKGCNLLNNELLNFIAKLNKFVFQIF